MSGRAIKNKNTDLPPHGGPPERGRRLSAVLALAMHALLVGFLVLGVRWQTHSVEPVEVELVSPPQPASPPVPSPPETAPPAPAPLEKTEAPPPKPDIVLKEKPREKTKPPQPDRKPDPFQNLLEQELKQASAGRKTAEMANAAARELAELQKAQAVAARTRSDADYIERIGGKIRGRIPVSALPTGNPVARFAVTQLPSGEVLQVQRIQSSGFSVYDDAIERAIRASSPLPRPNLGEAPHDLILTFCPDETRGCK